jgi:hypothetical protein
MGIQLKPFGSHLDPYELVTTFQLCLDFLCHLPFYLFICPSISDHVDGGQLTASRVRKQIYQGPHRQTRNSSCARERSSRKICLRFWKCMWNSLNSRCGSQYIEGFPQKSIVSSLIYHKFMLL